MVHLSKMLSVYLYISARWLWHCKLKTAKILLQYPITEWGHILRDAARTYRWELVNHSELTPLLLLGFIWPLGLAGRHLVLAEDEGASAREGRHRPTRSGHSRMHHDNGGPNGEGIRKR